MELKEIANSGAPQVDLGDLATLIEQLSVCRLLDEVAPYLAHHEPTRGALMEIHHRAVEQGVKPIAEAARVALETGSRDEKSTAKSLEAVEVHAKASLDEALHAVVTLCSTLHRLGHR